MSGDEQILDRVKREAYEMGRKDGIKEAHVVDGDRDQWWYEKGRQEAAADALEDAALTLPLWPEDRMSLRDRAAHIRSGATS